MKNACLVALAVVAVAGCRSAQQKKTIDDVPVSVQAERVAADSLRRPLEFDDLVWDFGRVDEAKGVVSHTATFENTTDRPVSVVRVQTACGCIRADFTKRPVMPSERGEVTIIYNPAYRSGFFSEALDIIYVSEGYERERYVRIWANGTVIPCLHPIEEDHPYDLGEGLHTNLKVLLAGTLAAGEQKSIILNYANSQNKKVKIRFEVEGETAASLDMPRRVTLKADERAEMRIVYTMPAGVKGLQKLTVRPFVNGKPAETLEFSVTAV